MSMMSIISRLKSDAQSPKEQKGRAAKGEGRRDCAGLFALGTVNPALMMTPTPAGELLSR
jgi:hypothetical protein